MDRLWQAASNFCVACQSWPFFTWKQSRDSGRQGLRRIRVAGTRDVFSTVSVLAKSVRAANAKAVWTCGKTLQK